MHGAGKVKRIGSRSQTAVGSLELAMRWATTQVCSGARPGSGPPWGHAVVGARQQSIENTVALRLQISAGVALGERRMSRAISTTVSSSLVALDGSSSRNARRLRRSCTARRSPGDLSNTSAIRAHVGANQPALW
jgi:hypothetical protein